MKSARRPIGASQSPRVALGLTEGAPVIVVGAATTATASGSAVAVDELFVITNDVKEVT
jgi:hypothetical protein